MRLAGGALPTKNPIQTTRMCATVSGIGLLPLCRHTAHGDLHQTFPTDALSQDLPRQAPASDPAAPGVAGDIRSPAGKLHATIAGRGAPAACPAPARWGCRGQALQDQDASPEGCFPMCPHPTWRSLLTPSDAVAAAPRQFGGRAHVTTGPAKLVGQEAACGHPQPWGAHRQVASSSTGTLADSRAGLSPTKGGLEANCKPGGGSLPVGSIAIAEHPAG